MPQQLITYSIVKALYDRGLDYIDAFWPFLLDVLPRDRTAVQMRDMQRMIEEKFGLAIPQHALSTIARRAKKRGLLTIRQGAFASTQQGIEHVEALETERDVQRRINEMLEDARRFLAERFNEQLNRDEMRAAVEGVIANNLDLFSAYVGGQRIPVDEGDRDLDRRELLIIEYFQHVEESNVGIFRTLNDLIAGSILASSLNTDSFADSGMRFEPTNLYVDTNFAFSALGLGYEEVNRPARELLDLLKRDRAFSIKIFDFTVAEAIALLQRYESEYKTYVSGVKVDHIFSSMRTKGWNPSDVREFIARIDEKLEETGIHVVTTGIRLKNFSPAGTYDVSVLARYKPEQGPLGQNHDLAAIEMIEKLRRRTVRRIQHAREFFLTSDFRLARYAYSERGHEQNSTISEVIPDRLLTNLLWLKSPDLLADLSVDAFISMHSRDLLIDREVWQRFYRSVKGLRESGDIDQQDVNTLLYDRHVLESLRIVPADSAEQVDETFVLGSLEAAHEAIDAKSAAKANDAAEEARINLQGEHAQTLNELDRRFNDLAGELERLRAQDEAGRVERTRRANRVRDKLRKQSQASARKWVIAGKILLLAVVCAILFPIVTRLAQQWDTYEPAVWAAGLGVTIFLGITGWRYDFLHLWAGLEARLEERFYESKVVDVWILLPEAESPIPGAQE